MTQKLPLFSLSLLAVALVACGGGTPTQTDEPVGQSSQGSENPAYDLDTELDREPPAEDAGTSTAAADAGTTEAPDAAPVTFVLTNSHSEPLYFNLDRGWGGAILAFSGTPPDAVSILPFPKFCTAACDAAEDDICPYCPEPERLKDIRESQQLHEIAPGATFEVPWDGQVHVYEKTKGKRRNRKVSCSCYKKQPVPDAAYTVRACGLRLTTSAKTSSKLQCVDGSMTFPADGPQRLELAFPDPGSKK